MRRCGQWEAAAHSAAGDYSHSAEVASSEPRVEVSVLMAHGEKARSTSFEPMFCLLE